jgi:hypothetical protein
VAVVAAVAFWASGDPWPWLYAVGAVVVLALVGVRRWVGPVHTAAAGLVGADVVWLAAVPWWGWCLAVGLAAGVTLSGLIAAGRLQPRTWQAAVGAGLVLAMVVAGGIGWAVDAAGRSAREARDRAQAHEDAVARILPHGPGAMVAFLVRQFAEGTPEGAANFCFVFADPAARQLAAAFRVPDCPAAFAVLAGQVRDPVGYQDAAWLPGSAVTYVGEAAMVDACRLDVGADTPGPAALGHLTLVPYRGGGDQITAYTGCGA